MKSIDNIKDFWRRQSKNYKAFLFRDTMNRLLGGGIGGAGGGGRGGGQYWSVFIKRLGATTVEIGIIRSISSAVNMFLALPSGWFTDRTKNLKKLYLTGQGLFVPTALLRFLATTWPFCILVEVWQTVCMRIRGSASQIIWIRGIRNEDRVMGLSLHRMITSIAGIFGPLICAYIINYFGGIESAEGIRPLFFIQFVIGFLIFIILYTQLQDVTFTRAKRNTSIVSQFLSVFKEVPVLKLLVLRQFVNRFIMDVRMPFQSIYFADVKGADEFIIGWRGTVSTSMSVLLAMPMSIVIERVGRVKIPVLGRVIGWIAYLIIVFTPLTHPEYLVIASVFEGLRMVMFVGWQASIQELIPLEARGRYSGVSMMFNGLAGVIAPIIGGIIWELDPSYIWWINLFGDALIVVPLMIIIGRKISERRTQTTK